MMYIHTRITPQTLRSHPKNPAICKFMIQIGRFDQLGSGVLNIHKYLPIYANGAEPVFRETSHGFELTLALPETAATGQDTMQNTPEVTPEVNGAESGAESNTHPTMQVTVQDTMQVTVQVDDLLKIFSGTHTRQDLQEILGLANRDYFRLAYLHPALAAGLIERTLPDKPNSRLQKYRLTEKGRQMAERVNQQPENAT